MISYHEMVHKINCKIEIKKYLLKLEDVFTYMIPRMDIYEVSKCRRNLAGLIQEQRKLYELTRTEKAKFRMLICHGTITIFNKLTAHFKLNEMNDYIDHKLITDHAFCMAIARTGNDLGKLKDLAYETAIINGLTPIYSKDGKIMTFIRQPNSNKVTE